MEQAFMTGRVPLRGAIAAVLAGILVVPALASDDASLAGTSWTATIIGGAPVPDTEATYTLIVEEGGGISGSWGCSSYGGVATFKTEAVSFSTYLNYDMWCSGSPPLMPFINLLGSATHYRIDAGDLSLTDASGAETLRFAPGVRPRPF